MTPQGLLTMVGATALGYGLLTGSLPALPSALAQEATPPAAEVPAHAEQGQERDFEERKAEAYSHFVAALASELGTDEAAVDAAIRTALIQQVDAREAAGDLDVEQAAAIRAVIEVSQAPLFAGFDGQHEMRGFDGHDGRHGGGKRGVFAGRGPHDGIDGESENRPGAESVPATLPDDSGAAEQVAPAPGAPSEDVVL